MLLEIHTSQQQEPHGKQWNEKVFMLHFVLNFQLLQKFWSIYSSTSFFTEERVQLSIQTTESLLPYVDERKCSSISHEFEIIEDKYQSFKEKRRYGKKRKHYTVLAELFG